MSVFNFDDFNDKIDQLNYRVVDDEVLNDNFALEEEEFDDEEHEADADDEVIEFNGTSGNKFKARRGSLSVDLNMQSPFISRSVKGDNDSFYKPTLEDFQPIKVLGKGSYGKVLLVQQISTGKLFAQKQLKKISLLMNEEKNLERTLNERKILEKVNHVNIVRLFYAFQDFNKVYLILEYLDGGELFYHLSQEQYLSETSASFYIAQLILALRYLHLELNVIYRDLKPENCMLNSEGNLVLTDFGLSKVIEEDERNHSFIGTIQYMAPEILKNEAYSYEVDWWSLGCIAFDLLTGSPPFTGNNNKKITEKILASKKNLKFPFYLSLDAKNFLRKLLVVNIDKRLNLDDDEIFEKIKKDRFFRKVDWNLINDNRSLPPILPIITNPILAENFDKQFTEMEFTPPNKFNDDILHVKDFTFTNDKFLNNYYEMKK
ncbi:serine/threonine-protein kinase Ypk3p [[Candida] jaroonii]|uniref:Serine/threonine-protein kinase Ypk3p n=1 Tax=[Candida] jaroonii TaxID=467808 RepID=A0ACA9Y906_9ASCO|nr:serine/threonine-protein kinase Ypk3p [[Candida] jaroonii]